MYSKNISVIRNKPIYFSHIKDNPVQSEHTFHLHDYGEIYIFISGDVDFIVDCNYHSLNLGDIIVTGPNIIHRPVIKSNADYERYYIAIPLDSFDCLDTKDNIFACFNRSSTFISPDDNIRENVLSILKEIETGLIQKNYGYDYLIFAKLFELLNIVSINMGSYLADTTENSMLISKALAFLKANSSSVNTVNEIADALNVNASYLSGLFSKKMNVSLKKYITASKISTAKTLLGQGFSVKETGLNCGYCTTSHFIAAFKSLTGQTPNEYKRCFIAPKATK